MSDTNNVTKLNILDALYAIYTADELQGGCSNGHGGL